MWNRVTTAEVDERLEHLDVPFNRYGLDPYGISREHLGAYYSMLSVFYRDYFRVRTVGIEHVPATGPALIIGNHSGGLPVDAAMLCAATFFEPDSPRHCHGMVEKFANRWPVVSSLFSRIGQLTGLPEHAVRLLQDERLLLVFPEGARGTGKLYKDRYKLVRFGTGFMRIALKTGVPIVPFAFVGGEEALPIVYHSKTLAKLTGAPYWPVSSYLLPIPRPFPCNLHFGEPISFPGNGTESDEVIISYVDEVKRRIEGLIEDGREARRARK